LSEKGHNNFWYPTSEQVIVPRGCNYEKLNWISGNANLSALKIRKDCILPIDCKELTVQNMSPPNNNDYVVVWTESDKIHIPA
jgi:hypothetical protein